MSYRGLDTHHRMLDVEVDALLVGVDPDLDRIVDRPAHVPGSALAVRARRVKRRPTSLRGPGC